MTASLQNKEPVRGPQTGGELRSAFRFLDEQEIDRFCSALEVRRVPPNGFLMEEGQSGDFMGFLKKGRLAVKKETHFPGKHILLAVLDPGSMVGEISALEGGRRNATVVALEESEVLILTRDRLDALLAADPILGVKVLKRIIQVLGLRLQKADDRLANLL